MEWGGVDEWWSRVEWSGEEYNQIEKDQTEWKLQCSLECKLECKLD